MSNDANFGNVPYLALPTLVLIIVTIGVGIALHFESVETKESTPTPLPHSIPIVETVEPYKGRNCVILEETSEYTVLKCYDYLLDENI